MSEQLNKALIDDLDRKFANYPNYNREIAIRKDQLRKKPSKTSANGICLVNHLRLKRRISSLTLLF